MRYPDVRERNPDSLNPQSQYVEDPRAPGRMRADLTLEGDDPSVIGYRALGELVARAAPIRRLAFEQSQRG